MRRNKGVLRMYEDDEVVCDVLLLHPFYKHKTTDDLLFSVIQAALLV